MKSFILKISSLGLVVLTFLLIGEYCVRKVPNPYRHKHQWMLANAKEVQTLILGSSHTYYGLNPENFSFPTFNLANVSQNYAYDCFLLEQYIDKCVNLKSIILPVSYFSLFSERFEDGDAWWCAINYKLYMNCDFHSDFSKYNFELAHWSVCKGKLLSFFTFDNKLRYTPMGMGTDYALEKKTRAWSDAEKAIERHTAEDFSMLGINLKYLNRMVSLCKKRGLNLVLITTPTWYTYYENLNEKQLSKMYEVIERLLENNAHISYYDFLTDNRFEEDDFYDCDHLSNVGAEKFSKILNEILKGI